MKSLMFILLLVVLLNGCTDPDRGISLETSDGVKISGFIRERSPDTAIIFLHMLDGKKEDWDNLNLWIADKNYTTLAIDFRGHGESEGDWKTFNEDDFKKMLFDVEAAKNYLKKKGYNNIYIAGASIGANIALRYAVTDNEIQKIILFSPGENYKGITTLDVLDDYKGELYLFSPVELDKEHEFALLLKESFKGEKKLRVLNGAQYGHGTKMVENFDYGVYPDFELFLRR